MAFAIALLSFYISYVMCDAFAVADWSHYTTLALVDLCFLYIVSAVRMTKLKRRWMSCVLTLTIVAASLSSIVLYIYEYFDISAFNFLATSVIDVHFSTFSVVASVLLLLISITPKRILHAFDRIAWPKSLSDVYSCTSCDDDKNPEEGI